MRPLRWAVIGLGIGELHANEIDLLEESELVALCDRDPAVLARVAQRFPHASLYADADAMISIPELDAIVVSTYDESHADLVISALRQGLHVFVEKPLATTREQIDLVTQLLNTQRSLRLSTNTLLRLSPRFERLKHEIDSGSLGRIFHAELTYLYGRLEKITHGWRGHSPDYSVTLGGTIHMIDLLLWLIGERPYRCSGIGSSLGTTASNLGSNISSPPQDLRVALLEFPSGVTAQVGANFACVTPHFHSVAMFGTRGTFFHLPQGTAGAQGTAFVQRERDPDLAPDTLDMPYPAVSKAALLRDFEGAIRGGPLAVSEQEALNAGTVAVAIDVAIATREAVEINYPTVSARLSDQ